MLLLYEGFTLRVCVCILFVDSFCQGSQLSLQVGTHETFGRPVPKYVLLGPAVVLLSIRFADPVKSAIFQ